MGEKHSVIWSGLMSDAAVEVIVALLHLWNAGQLYNCCAVLHVSTATKMKHSFMYLFSLLELKGWVLSFICKFLLFTGGKIRRVKKFKNLLEVLDHLDSSVYHYDVTLNSRIASMYLFYLQNCCRWEVSTNRWCNWLKWDFCMQNKVFLFEVIFQFLLLCVLIFYSSKNSTGCLT